MVKASQQIVTFLLDSIDLAITFCESAFALYTCMFVVDSSLRSASVCAKTPFT